MNSKAVMAAAVLAAMLCVAPVAAAHCDSLNGPVVKDARQALEKGSVAPVLKWVGAKDEASVRAAFAKAVSVRKLSPEARELADHYFFETLVRLHRAGEGAAYTGLKTPEEANVPACVVEADKALETGSIDDLARHMSEEVAGGIRERFRQVQERRRHADASASAGREFVASYVAFIHYVEALHAANEQKSGHLHEAHAVEARAGSSETGK